MDVKKRRRPVEAIEQRTRRRVECGQRMRKALIKLTKTGAPFTVDQSCFAARDASQVAVTIRAEQNVDKSTASWRERALNAEALSKTLRAAVKDRDDRIADLTGQLYDRDGTHLADENARLRDLVLTLNKNLHHDQIENNSLRRSLDGARANVKRERERDAHSCSPIPPTDDERWI
jgi:hypothetical protein